MKYIKIIDELTKQVSYISEDKHVRLERDIYDGITWYHILIDGTHIKTVRKLKNAIKEVQRYEKREIMGR